jgi:hypothetical protein
MEGQSRFMGLSKARAWLTDFQRFGLSVDVSPRVRREAWE